MPAELFDMELRALRRDRAFRRGGELFLLERVFEDCLDRLGLLRQGFGSALLIGCPDPAWPHRLRDFAREVAVLDPGRCFAQAAGGSCVVEDELEVAAERHDLCVAVGTLDTVNDLPRALTRIRASLAPGAFFLGAFAGGIIPARNLRIIFSDVDGSFVAAVMSKPCNERFPYCSFSLSL